MGNIDSNMRNDGSMEKENPTPECFQKNVY